MNLGSCDQCGKTMTIADCIQEEDGHIFCSRLCKEKYAGRDEISGNQLALTKDVFYDDWNSQQLGEVPNLRRDFPFRLGQTRAIRRVSEH